MDGFNLYYGCVKGTPYRWLDLSKLCTMLLPGYDIKQIKYFTSLVVPRSEDPQQLDRQMTYLRALKTIPNLEIYYGQFLTHAVRKYLARPPAQGAATVEVLDTREKGSDVNLASHLLVDGFDQRYQVAIVVSSDSDLVEPIKLVIHRLGLSVGVLHPHTQHSKELRQVASFYRPIRERALKVCQFPTTLTDSAGTITKPLSW